MAADDRMQADKAADRLEGIVQPELSLRMITSLMGLAYSTNKKRGHGERRANHEMHRPNSPT